MRVALTLFLYAAAAIAAPGVPVYAEESIVNGASNKPGPLAPNMIGTIYGKELSIGTAGLAAQTDVLPTALPGTSARVIINNMPVHLYFVSPTQINFLVPSNLRPGPAELQITLEGRAGPAVRMTIADVSPALFAEESFVAATKQDGSVVNKENPARPGEVIVMYATGLGTTRPTFAPGQIARGLAQVSKPGFKVQIGGTVLGGESVFYAGLCPGFAGLYQINIRVPETAGENPEVRIGFEEIMSPEGVKLLIRPN